MDISVGQYEEMKKQRRHEGMKKQQNPGASPSEVGTDSVSSNASEDEESLGQMIGEDDPFELAYVQPVIRASPHARPEQPFPPVSLRVSYCVSPCLYSSHCSSITRHSLVEKVGWHYSDRRLEALQEMWVKKPPPLTNVPLFVCNCITKLTGGLSINGGKNK